MFKHQTIIVFAVLLALSAQTLLLTEACTTVGGNGGNGRLHLRVTRSVVEGSALKVVADAGNPGPVAEVKSTVDLKDEGIATGHPAVVVNPKTSARK